jgi:integrase
VAVPHPSFPHNKLGAHLRQLQAAFNSRFSRKLGKHIGLLRGVCGIMDPDLTLHSVRHSWITAARAAGVDDATSDRITGHDKRTVSARYGSMPLPILAAAVALVDPLV